MWRAHDISLGKARGWSGCESCTGPNVLLWSAPRQVALAWYRWYPNPRVLTNATSSVHVHSPDKDCHHVMIWKYCTLSSSTPTSVAPLINHCPTEVHYIVVGLSLMAPPHPHVVTATSFRDAQRRGLAVWRWKSTNPPPHPYSSWSS
jgi:hypothetical protein